MPQPFQMIQRSSQWQWLPIDFIALCFLKPQQRAKDPNEREMTRGQRAVGEIWRDRMSTLFTSCAALLCPGSSRTIVEDHWPAFGSVLLATTATAEPEPSHPTATGRRRFTRK